MTERLPANVSHFFSFPQSIFVSFLFFLFYLAFHTFHSLSTHCSLPLQITSCLFSVFFNFLAVFHLCCCAPFNLSWSILPLPLVPRSLPSHSWFSAYYLFFSLSPLFSSHACLIHRHKETRYICFLAILYSGNNCRVV